MKIRPGMKRVYAFAITGAVVVTALAGASLTQGASEQQQSAFVPITPCRLFDTRPSSKVGALRTFKKNDTQTASVRGENGECNIPQSATGVALNVTSIGGTAPSFLQLWPAGAARPTSSNLNWGPGQAPTPNKVDIGLSAAGKMSVYNLDGQVDVIADVVGYYSPVERLSGTISAVQVRSATITMEVNASGTGSNGNATAECLPGWKAIAGGVEGPESTPLNVRASRPEPLNDPTGWFGDVRSSSKTPGEESVTATVYAVCITLST